MHDRKRTRARRIVFGDKVCEMLPRNLPPIAVGNNFSRVLFASFLLTLQRIHATEFHTIQCLYICPTGNSPSLFCSIKKIKPGAQWKFQSRQKQYRRLIFYPITYVFKTNPLHRSSLVSIHCRPRIHVFRFNVASLRVKDRSLLQAILCILSSSRPIQSDFVYANN